MLIKMVWLMFTLFLIIWLLGIFYSTMPAGSYLPLLMIAMIITLIFKIFHKKGPIK